MINSISKDLSHFIFTDALKIVNNKKGRNLLLERTNEIMNYLFERRDIINEISKPEFIDRLIKKLE